MKYPTKAQIKKIENIVKKDCSKSRWKHKKGQWEHIYFVRKHALQLAGKLKADKKVIEVAALLHDIGRIRYEPKDHEITSAEDTEKILRKMNLDKKFIRKVKAAVLSHRSGAPPEPKTKEEKIIAAADAMHHFDIVPRLISLATYELKLNPEQAREWTLNKIKRDWKKVSKLPAAKKMIQKKYEAAILLLGK